MCGAATSSCCFLIDQYFSFRFSTLCFVLLNTKLIKLPMSLQLGGACILICRQVNYNRITMVLSCGSRKKSKNHSTKLRRQTTNGGILVGEGTDESCAKDFFHSSKKTAHFESLLILFKSNNFLPSALDQAVSSNNIKLSFGPKQAS